jgi:hypothetical protein
MATGLRYYEDSANAGANTNVVTPAGGPTAVTTVAYNAISGPPFPILTDTTPTPTVPFTNPGFNFGGWILYSTTQPGITPSPVTPIAPSTTIIQGQTIDGTTYEYRFYPQWNPAGPVICFREGSTILSHENGEDVYKPVETLRPGTLVKTLRDGYLPISVIGHSQIYNPANAQRSKNRLYKLSPAKYPELTSDLYLTGCHSVLVDALTAPQKEDIREDYNAVFVTDKKFRLPAYLDDRAEPFAEEGNFTIWHFALEGEDVRKNHGVYANGLLVESSFRKHVESRGGMTLVE